MPPALALGRVLSRSRGLQSSKTKTPPICLFCTHSPSQRLPSPLLSTTTALRSQTQQQPPPSTPRTKPPQRNHSTSHSSPRADLHRALLDLQTHAPNHISLPRLQLALRNLTEPPGHESVRVAILSLATNEPPQNTTITTTTTKPTTATRLLRLALADPLQPAAAWEAQLEAHDTQSQPLVVRAGATATEAKAEGPGQEQGLQTGRGRDRHVIPELRVATPLLPRGAELEMLVAGAGPPLAAAAAAGGGNGGVVVDEAVLVPTAGVAATTAGHVAPVGTPVHMALLVGDGVRGAAGIMALPLVEGRDVIAGAVNFAQVGSEDLEGCPLVAVNVDTASEGLELFRADVGNAIKYETLWTEANVGRISEWLRKSALPNDEGVMKPPVRNLIGSLLRNARAAVQEEETRDLAAELRSKVSPRSIAHLDKVLAEWAQNAHQELQQQLDVAFTTGPWSRLGWWKLFWRADDVGMVTSEMVALRFLPDAEKGVIYLAGRIQEAGVAAGQQGRPRYAGPALPQPSTGPQKEDTITPDVVNDWPPHIPFTRNYLQQKTVPALQALSQKLVVQSASLAGLSTALAGLSYLSALGAYECGAIAALGVAFSFKRFQQKWDSARKYWEGEVREEGRKAIRATEASVAEVLDKAGKTLDPQADQSEQLKELSKIEEIITRAEKAYAQIK
ncbi:uncharacterized protein B0H64DRAFT_472499 [Chaetomium fimeti]|uniref:Mmc1 C-terminal domain-containing protein n=1 Tax=Chaetomium fimeti TaxID=1854472 RepID=A0AAE0HNC1_9PEZI|nr:hypothetical protein B0H64DRAFT_472499 [Chaetomium fimeti]